MRVIDKAKRNRSTPSRVASTRRPAPAVGSSDRLHGGALRDELREQIPEIDAVIGTGELPEIVNAIGAGNGGLIPLLAQWGTYRVASPESRFPDPIPGSRGLRATVRRQHAASLATPRHYGT